MYVSNLWEQFILGLLEQDRGGGSGGSGTGNSSDTSDDDASTDTSDASTDDTDDSSESDEDLPPTKQQSPAKAFEQLVERYNGDTQALAEKLFRDNFKLRASNRLRSDEIKTLQTQIPRKGAIQLPKQEFATYQDYKKLGTPKQIRDTQTELTRIRDELTTSRQDNTLTKVAEVAGYNKAALAELGGKLTYEVREVDDAASGKKVAEAYVIEVETVNGQKVRKETPVKTYANDKWKVFLPSLTSGDGSSNGSNDTTGNRSEGRRFVRQAPAGSNNANANGSNGNKGVASGYLQRTYGKAKP